MASTYDIYIYHHIKYHHKHIKLLFRDTAGQERFRTFTKMHFRGTKVEYTWQKFTFYGKDMVVLYACVINTLSLF